MFFKSTTSAIGGLISIVRLSIDERDVAEEPIIWFIASLIALRCSSPISPFIFVPSPPIIRSVIIFTSFSLSTRILLPFNPCVYPILINTHGFSYSSTILSQFEKETTGVEISTLLFTSENSVVAAVPILILAISPIASFSDSVNISSLESAASLLFNNAFISSCDKTPSMIYCSSLTTDVILTAYLSPEEPGSAVNFLIFPT